MTGYLLRIDYLNSSKEEQKELEKRVSLLGKHLHFSEGISCDSNQFFARKEKDFVIISPIGQNLPRPYFYSMGRDGVSRYLDLELIKSGYKIKLKENFNNSKWESYLLLTTPERKLIY